MANNLPTFPAFEAGTNPLESWRLWKEDFEDYLEALRYSETPEKTKTALFLHLCGEELKKQLRAFDLKPNDGCDDDSATSASVNKNAVIFKLDIGSQVNVIPKSELLKWEEKPAVRNCKIAVLDYSDNRVPILELILKEFADVFTGTGRLKRIVKIKLKENFVAHVAAPRKVSLAIHNKVKKELNNMIEAGIITKVEEPTEWVSKMVVIDSPKKLRICLDPRPLNEAIQRPHYPIPKIDTLVTKLQGGKVFTVLDAKNGFGQLPLDEESSYLTTFSTPWGRYRFLAFPFGLNPAPEEFQKAIDKIYEEDVKILTLIILHWVQLLGKSTADYYVEHS
ncbi:retrovirus-related Pol polyprotein from transposon 17.6 [Nephila pilipes]|uniref:Retrovirus-related Pol polyprotein from transposon 17.6 n=1 Tax=Nephila pilipes TaxID=299642 RepID=A0A8X6UG74_NEPPI|nr:retrovirus-related Pol polyprotein from transposon 17.6 [Nephila pilipes]